MSWFLLSLYSFADVFSLLFLSVLPPHISNHIQPVLSSVWSLCNSPLQVHCWKLTTTKSFINLPLHFVTPFGITCRNNRWSLGPANCLQGVLFGEWLRTIIMFCFFTDKDAVEKRLYVLQQQGYIYSTWRDIWWKCITSTKNINITTTTARVTTWCLSHWTSVRGACNVTDVLPCAT